MSSVGFQAKVLAQGSISAALGILVDDFKARNRTLTVIQVGACNGRIEDDHLHEVIKGQSHVEAHLIEAVAWLFNELDEVMSPYAGHIHCHHATLGARDETRPFYSVSPQYGFDQPDAEAWRRYQIGSLTDEHLKIHVPKRYISTDVVQVESPTTFMNRAEVDPEDLNLLMTDTEGFDGEIVNAFLETARPEMIVYEHHVMPAEDNARLCKLLDDGTYACKVIGNDVLAYRVPE